MQDLVEKLSNLLRAQKMKLLCAESCTGGMLAAAMTDLPGSSDFFSGGVVSYSNEMKTVLLHVGSQTLQQQGAVSAQTAGEMLSGLLSLRLGDVGIAITGIAGPGGGTEQKPIGLVYIACGGHDRTKIEEFSFVGDRAAVRRQAVEAALRMGIRYLDEAAA